MKYDIQPYEKESNEELNSNLTTDTKNVLLLKVNVYGEGGNSILGHNAVIYKI